MKFLQASLFITQAIAFSLDTRSPALISRQAATDIASSIATIQAATQSLNTAVSFGDLLALTSANSAVVNAIKAATSEANGLSTSLKFDDATTLSTPIKDLGKAFDSTITKLIGKSSSMVDARQTILSGLESQLSASAAFSTALSRKVPDHLQSTAMSLAQPITDSLARGIAEYSKRSIGGRLEIRKAAPAGAIVTQIADGQIQAPKGSVQPTVSASVIPASVIPASVIPASVLPVTASVLPISPSIISSTIPTKASSAISTAISKSSISNIPAAYVMPTLSTITGIPSYSLPGCTTPTNRRI